MNTYQLTTAQIAVVAERFRALAEPARLHLMNVMQAGERTVGELAAASGMGLANVSKHLRVLLGAGFVSRRKTGLHVFYGLAGDHVFQLCHLMCTQLVFEQEQTRSAFARVGEDANDA